MKINEVIKEQRKELKLTQEQVAEYLGISTPAVSKWESGNSYPDITLLPPLARLLKIDINTLFSFHEALTEKEVARFGMELITVIQNEGITKGFILAKEKLQSYPQDEPLLSLVANLLQAHLELATIDNEQKALLKEEVRGYFARLVDSENPNIRFSAQVAIARQSIENQDFQQAEELVSSIEAVNLDKTPIEIQLLLAQNREEEAQKLMEQKILQSASEVYTYLTWKFELAVSNQKSEDMSYYEHILVETASTYKLHPVFAVIPQLIVAIVHQDKETTLHQLRKLVSEMKNPWMVNKHFLYRNMETQEVLASQLFFRKSLEKLLEPADLSFIEQDSEYLRITEEWEQLVTGIQP